MSEHLDSKRTTTSHETPIKCPYGCGKDIAKTKVVIKLPDIIKQDLMPQINLQMYYEMTEDGDLGHIHICKKFQKVMEAYAEKKDYVIEKDIMLKEIDTIREIISESKNSDIENTNERNTVPLADDILETFSRFKKINQTDLDKDKVSLEKKLIDTIECMKCHNFYTPIVELGNLYNSKGLFNVAIEIFNIVLQWNRYEPVSNIGKIEAQLQSGIDEKSSATMIEDCKKYYKDYFERQKVGGSYAVVLDEKNIKKMQDVLMPMLKKRDELIEKQEKALKLDPNSKELEKIKEEISLCKDELRDYKKQLLGLKLVVKNINKIFQDIRESNKKQFWKEFFVGLDFSYTNYFDGYFKSKIDYLDSIINLRWNRENAAKKRLKLCIENLEKLWISKYFDEDDIEKGLSGNLFEEKTERWMRETRKLIEILEGELDEKVEKPDAEIEIFPHFDLLSHAIELLQKITDQTTDKEFFVYAEQIEAKYQKLKGRSEEIQKLEKDNIELDISRIEKLVPKEELEKYVRENSELNELHQTILEEQKEMSEELEEFERIELEEGIRHEYEELVEQRDVEDDMEHEWESRIVDEDGDFNDEEKLQERQDDISRVADSDGTDFPQQEYWKTDPETRIQEKIVETLDQKLEKDMEKYHKRVLPYLKKFGYTDEEVFNQKYTQEEYNQATELLDKDEYEAEVLINWKKAKQYLLEDYPKKSRRILQDITEFFKIERFTGENFENIKKSIKEQGQSEPIFLDENQNIIDGKRRFAACKELGIEPQVVIVNMNKVGTNYSTSNIPITKISDQDMLGEIEIAFRKLIKRKLSNLDNWENENIPKEVLEQAKYRLEEAKLSPYGVPGNSWLEYLEVKDFEKIFCYHCKTCSKNTYRDKKTGKPLSGHHKPNMCKKSNWDLYFRRVFGGNYKIFQGELETFRGIRNSLSHHSGPSVDKILSQDGKEELKRLYTKWNKLLCKDQDVSNLV